MDLYSPVRVIREIRGGSCNAVSLGLQPDHARELREG
jgi:hypothetical protein